MNINKVIQYRQQILMGLIILIFLSFILSYAVNSITLFLFLGFFFLDKKSKIKEKWNLIKKNKLVLLYFLFFIIQVLGIFYSENTKFAIRRAEVMLPLLFLPAILSVEKLNQHYYNKVLIFLKYSILIIFSVYLLIHLFIDNKIVNTFVYFTVQEKFKVSQFYLAFILMVPLLVSIQSIKNHQKLFINIITLFISLFFLLILGNKTLLIFLIIMSFLKISHFSKQSFKKGAIAILSFFVLTIFIYKIPIVKNKIAIVLKTTDFDLETIITKNRFTFTKNTLEHRLLFNYLTILEIKKNLPFGVGTGDFQKKLDAQYKRIGFKFAMKGNVNNHNQYLSEFLKTGVLGGFTFIFLIIYLLKSSIIDTKIAFPIVLFFALACSVESYLFRQHGVVIFAFIIPFFIFKKQ